MEKFCVLFLVYFTTVIVSGTEKRTCDYAFGCPSLTDVLLESATVTFQANTSGDASWNYSKVYYDEDVKFPAGVALKRVTVTRPIGKGPMISYVCVNLPVGINKQTTKVNFNPLDAELSVALAKEATKEFNFHVLAMNHGY